jgi:hypothetical protein
MRVLVVIGGRLEKGIVLQRHRCGKVMVRFPQWDDTECIPEEDLYPDAS